MKRRKLIHELEDAGCYLNRHGAKHDIYVNPKNGEKAPSPSHREITESLCKLIRKQLGIK